MAADVDLAPFKKLLLTYLLATASKRKREQALSAGLRRRITALGIDTCETYHALLLHDQE